ncbi:MAG TPA: DUF1631 family protein [Pseudomonadales bacterium]|nr:DUF1631 family protein [Pseudomonadales bacterium]
MDSNQTARHLAELQNLAVSFADKLQEQYLPAVESRLMEMADMAKNNEQQWRLLQLVRETKRQKAMLGNAFKKHLADGFQQFQRNELGGKDTRKEDMSADLSLVANDELEENLASSSLSRRAETRFAESLYALNQRMAVLKGGRKLSEDGNPLGPYQFADALQAEVHLLKLDSRLTVLFFRIFEKVLLEKLGDLYKSANDYLISQGVLPNLRYGVGSSGARPRPATPAAQQAAAPSPPAPAKPAPAMPAGIPERFEGSSENIQQQLYSAIRALQQLGAASLPTHGSSATVSHGEVVTALSAVALASHAETIEQAAVPPAMTLAQFQAVTHQLREQIGDDKHLGDENSRLIDLVGMIFEYMLGDRQLPDAVKAVLSYLHTPYLKAAFIDRALFESPEHPSRLLLNSLAEAGTRWVNSDGDSQFKVFPKIKSVVRRILTEFRHDMGLFVELLQEMQEFNQKVEHNIGLMERRAREKAEGEDRLREVKRRVLYEVRKRMDSFDLPSHMIVLLLHPWSDYLTFTLLRHGEESSQWQEGLDTVEDLIWSIQPKMDTNERNRLMLIQESLQGKVQTALETIAYDQAKGNRLQEALTQSQMLALQNLAAEPLGPVKRAEIEAEAAEDIGEDAPDVNVMTADERDLVQKLSMIEFGTWMEFDELDQYRNLRAKVAWFNARTSRYMLVDRSGKQISTKSGLDIARLILAGQARIISGSAKPFFERALENIFMRLKTAVTE